MQGMGVCISFMAEPRKKGAAGSRKERRQFRKDSGL